MFILSSPVLASAATEKETFDRSAHRSGVAAMSLRGVTWGGAFAGLAVAAGIWIFALHRKLRHHQVAVRTLRSLNFKLENRLNARTDELQKTRDELNHALMQDYDLDELKRHFVTMVSHEFRTPLGIIMSAIELMRHHGDRLPSAQLVELQDDIHDATRQMAELMEKVLVLGRLETGDLDGQILPLKVDFENQMSADSA